MMMMMMMMMKMMMILTLSKKEIPIRQNISLPDKKTRILKLVMITKRPIMNIMFKF